MAARKKTGSRQRGSARKRTPARSPGGKKGSGLSRRPGRAMLNARLGAVQSFGQGHVIRSSVKRSGASTITTHRLSLAGGEDVQFCTITCGNGPTVRCQCPAGKRCTADCSNPEQPKCACV